MRHPPRLKLTLLQPSLPHALAQILVPANWECRGHGRPQYLNFQYPFPIAPPFVPALNPTGCYRLEFDLPAALDAATLRALTAATLVFEGVDSAFYCWLNGAPLGYSQDSRLPAEFDAAAALRPGRNALAAMVLKWSDGSYLEDQDQWRLSGIHREVYLQLKPPARVADFFVRTPLAFADEQGGGPAPIAAAPALKAAALEIDVDVAALTQAELDCLEVRARLFEWAPGPDLAAPTPAAPTLELRAPLAGAAPLWAAGDAAAARSVVDLGAAARVALASGDLMAAFPGGAPPRLWSPEEPNLYILVLALLRRGAGGGEEEVLEMEATQVGFRAARVCRRRRALLHNGAPVTIRGVNRHEHDARLGKAVTLADMRRDAALMKAHNFNAVRCSHYPNHPRW